MASNIEIANELNKLLTEQLRIVEEQNKALKEQTKLSQAVLDSFSKVKNSRPSDAVNELNKAMKESSGTSNEFSTSLNKGLSEIAKRTYHADKTAKSFASTWTKLLKTPNKILAMEQGIQGFINGIQFSNGILGSMIKQVSSLASGMVNLGISIAMVPFKMLNSLMEEAAGTSGTELAQAIEEVRKQFGDLSKNEANAVMTSFRSLRGELANTGLSVHRVLGPLPKRLEFIRETAVAMGRSFNKFSKEFATHGEAITAYTKGLGLVGEQIKAITDFSNAAGKNMTEVGREITTMAYGVGEAFNVNGKLVSRDIADMMKDFKNFGSLSTKQLTQVSVFTHKLGIEINDLLGVIDKFDNFEDAANSAAQLSQAFGLQLDTLDLIFDQDPASRFEKLRKSFLATGKTVESLSRQEKALLAAQTGISESALQVGFSQANMGMSYEEVQKQASLTEKKQLSQAEAMEKLANSIDRFIQEGERMKGGFFDIFFQGFFKGVMIGGRWHKLMMEIKRSMREVWRAGREVGIAFVEMWPGVKDIFDSLHEFFDPKIWKLLRIGLVDTFKEFFNDVAGNGKFSLKMLIDRLSIMFHGFYDIQSPTGKKIVDGFKKFFKTLSNLAGELAEMMMKGLTYSIKEFGKFLENPSEYLANAKTTGSGFTKWVIEMLEPVMKAVSEQWPALRDALIKVGTFAFNKFVDYAKENWAPAIQGIFLYMAPALTGGLAKSLGSALLAGAVKGISEYALPKLGNVLSKFFGGFGKAAEAASSTTSGMSKAMEVVAESTEAVTKGAESAKKLSMSDIAKFGAKLLVVAGAISLGVVAFVYALVEVNKILLENGMNSVEKVAPPLLVLGAAITGITALGITAKGMDAVSWPALGKTALMAVAGVVALGALSWGLAFFFRKANDELQGVTILDATKTIAVLLGMITSMAALAALLLGAGFIIANPILGLMSLAGIAGLAALTTISYALVDSVIGLVEKIKKMNLGADFAPKLEAFATVIGTVTDFAKVLVDMMSEAKPSFFSLKGLWGDTGGSIEESFGSVNMIVDSLSINIGRIFESVKKAMTDIPPGMDLNIITAFIKLFSSVVEMASNLNSDTLKKTLDKVSNESASAGAIEKLTNALSKNIAMVADSISKIVPLVKNTFTEIGSLQMDENSFKKIDSFTQFMNSFSQLINLFQNDQVKVSTPGDNMINFLSGIQSSMMIISQKANDLKDIYISEAAYAVKTMVEMINGIQKDLKAISKSGDIKPLNVQLKQSADKLGLAGANEIKLKMDEINFHIHVDVKLSVDELEKSLLDPARNPKILGRK